MEKRGQGLSWGGDAEEQEAAGLLYHQHLNPTLLGNILTSPLTHPPQFARQRNKPICLNLQLISHICLFFFFNISSSKEPKIYTKRKKT